MRRVAVIARIVVQCLGATLFAAACVGSPTDAELARRVAASHPAWQSYQEDIKGQIGAGPVAEWEGEPVAVRMDGGAIHVTFKLTGPWATRDTAMPILIEHPLDTAHTGAKTHREGDRVTYTFAIPPGGRSTAIPWIDVKYPRHERRIILSPDGTWTPPTASDS